MRACGIDPDNHPELRTTDFYTSHEALLLGFEQAMTRLDSTSGDWYDTSAHMLWIGDRTRQPDHAHVEFFRGIKNPIGIKCGPSLDGRRTARADRHPQSRQRAGPADADLPLRRRQGREQLPALVRAVKREGRTVVWACDPMHGNTVKSTSGYKTRRFDAILSEVRGFFAVHRGRRHLCRRHPRRDDRHRTSPNAPAAPARSPTRDLNDRYHTFCDPRLNADQALELAFVVAELLKRARLAQEERNPAPAVASTDRVGKGAPAPCPRVPWHDRCLPQWARRWRAFAHPTRPLPAGQRVGELALEPVADVAGDLLPALFLDQPVAVSGKSLSSAP